MNQRCQANHISGTVSNPATAGFDSKCCFRKTLKSVSFFRGKEYDNKFSYVRTFSEMEAACSSVMWKCAEERIKLTLNLSIIHLYLMSCNDS